MKIIGNKELRSQPKFGALGFDDVTPESRSGDKRVQADTGPRQNIVVVQSDQSDVKLPGGKCEHGVYIPRYSEYQNEDRAEYCSVCNPYLVEVPGGNNGTPDRVEPGQTAVSPD